MAELIPDEFLVYFRSVKYFSFQLKLAKSLLIENATGYALELCSHLQIGEAPLGGTSSF